MKKVIILLLVFGTMPDLTAQKQNKLDTLIIDQLNVYKDKAAKLRNAGMILTFSGVGIVAAGIIVVDRILLVVPLKNPDDPEAIHRRHAVAFSVFGISCVGGIATTVVGISLWAIGGIKKSKAEIAIQKLNIVPENSMALGVGITINF